MAYRCELGNGQTLYLDCQGTQTMITLATLQPGQQQQSTTALETGTWTSTPLFYQTSSGVVAQISTALGKRHLFVQGNTVCLMNEVPTLNSAQSIQAQQVESQANLPAMTPLQMKPLQMEPMKMGDMQMSLNPMEMRMGSMEMRMESPTPTSKARQFCSQCGEKAQPSDHFCSKCGNSLG
ncbi:MAG: zinc ribbon domain-containing protein [Microcoleaceae cyanobacterium]